eukprot:scaffold30252_cov49-Cyclotella_meneghiniana.AAC.2
MCFGLRRGSSSVLARLSFASTTTNAATLPRAARRTAWLSNRLSGCVNVECVCLPSAFGHSYTSA